jgi:PAS domain-containing protein
MADQRAAGPARDLMRWFYPVAFLVGTALVLGFMWYHIESERRVVMDHWHARLSTFADDRARLVSDWLQSRKADAEVLAGSTSIQGLLAGEGDRGVTARLDRVVAAYGYLGIAVVNPSGQVVARTRDPDAVAHAVHAGRAAMAGQAFRIDIPKGADGARRLVFAIPVLTEGGAPREPLGAIVLTMAPERGLYPLLTDETVPTRTGEALLFRIEDQERNYISPFRAAGAGLPEAGRALEQLAATVPDAVAKKDTFGEITDYRGAPVLAATRWIPGPAWGLMLKIDRDEALEDFRQARYLTATAAIFLILAQGSLLIGLWRQRQRAQLLRDQMRQERAIFNLKSYAEKLVASVPSGLLVLAGDLRILSANRSFLTLSLRAAR